MFCVYLKKSKTTFLTFTQQFVFGVELSLERHQDFDFMFKTNKTIKGTI